MALSSSAIHDEDRKGIDLLLYCYCCLFILSTLDFERQWPRGGSYTFTSERLAKRASDLKSGTSKKLNSNHQNALASTTNMNGKTGVDEDTERGIDRRRPQLSSDYQGLTLT
eukprot:scaffold5366_cov138-Skeletonema_menzelii.AAC.4